MDMQLPPVIIGIIILISLVLRISPPENGNPVSNPVLYSVLILAFGMIGLGFYLNLDSLRAPESPFNRHVSPILLAAATIGALLFASWKLYGSGYSFLIFIFSIACIAIICAAIYLARIQNRTQEKQSEEEAQK